MSTEEKPATSKPGFDAQGNRVLKIRPQDSCLIIRPVGTDGFQTIVFHNFPPDMEEEDKMLYHVLMRGLAEAAVESTQEIVDTGMKAVRMSSGSVRPVDVDGNIREEVEPQPLDPRSIDLSTVTPRGKA